MGTGIAFFQKLILCDVLSNISSFLSPITRNLRFDALFRSQLLSGLFKPSWKCCKVQQRDDNSFDTDGWRLFSSRRSTTTVQHSSLLVYNSPKVLKKNLQKVFSHIVFHLGRRLGRIVSNWNWVFFGNDYTAQSLDKMWKIVGSNFLGICPSTNPRSDFSSSRKVRF